MTVLDELRIRGLGVIDEAVLPLGPGLTAVTGETGAGKTMVVTGLLLLFGGRADPARVRRGAEQASVDGRLLLDATSPAAERIRQAGGDLDDGGELLLRRTVGAAGRSRAVAGGAGVPAALLAELAEHLLAVHGQADQLRLVRPGAQRDALDRYAGIPTASFAALFTAWRAAEQELTDRTSRAAELRREADLLAHGLAEIDAVAPQPGEVEDLDRQSVRLAHAEGLQLAARTAHDALLGDPLDAASDGADVVSLLSSAGRLTGQRSGDDPQLDELTARLADLGAVAADLGSDFAGYADALQTDPARLEQVEQRRAALNSVLRKYCDEPEPSIDGVLRWAETARARLEAIDVSDEAIAVLRERRDAAAAAAARAAADISAQRHAAAQRLADAVSVELAGLAMPDARLDVRVTPRPVTAGGLSLVVAGTECGVGASGADDIEFLLAPHPSAPALPLSRGASGGELSRVMLALEVCLAGTGSVPTLVFDEVDAGVGGRAALEVGRRLARLARDRQVLVVTHLAQVAAFADRQVVVDKPGGGDASAVQASDVRLVGEDERVAELARMLAGSDSATAREHAAELLADAATERSSAPSPGTRSRRGRTGSRGSGSKIAPRG